MILSAVLLSLFVIQWLSLQYASTEKELNKDVRVDLKKTSDQLLDSMMLNLISRTIIKEYHSIDTLQLNENPTNLRISKTDSVVEETEVHVNIDTKIAEQKRIGFRKEIRKINPENGQTTIVQEEYSGPQDDRAVDNLFAKGLGVYARKLARQDGVNDVVTITNAVLDTTLCKNIMNRNWQQNGLEYALVFQPVNSKTTAIQSKSKSIIYSEDPLFQHRIGIKLTNKNSYIWWQIIPQLIFSLILLGVTVGAFVFVYRSYRKQVLLNELRTDFINNISHELKTPVSTVRVALEALQHYKRKSDPVVMDEYLQLMTKEVNRLDKLIDLVLTNALLEEKNSFLQLERINLIAFTENALLSYQWQLKQGNAQIDFQKNMETIWAQVDPIHLQGVLLNLLDNSIKYGGESPIIHLKIIENTHTITLEIADEGPGIQAPYVGQVFEKFFRVPTGNEHNVTGYGLGLHYCYQIMRHHLGNIEVQNLPLKGCVFRLTFPKPKHEN